MPVLATASSVIGRRWRSLDHRAVAILAVAFAVSRAAALAAGVRYDAGLLDLALQHVDNGMLRADLFGSIWYLHAQPPLWNLIIGLVLKLSPIDAGVTFGILFALLGAVLVGVTYRLLLALRVPRGAALVATIVITCSPTVILYENWLSYEYPLAVALTAAALAMVRWVQSGRLGWLATFAGLVGACVLVRALLNPVWFLAAIAVALLAGRRRDERPRLDRRAWAVVAVPTLLIAGVMVKNQVLFGTPAASSWAGWNLQRVTVDELTPETKQRLIDEGVLTPMANFPVFLPLDHYDPVRAPCVPAHRDVPVLNEPFKATGRENWNDECYLPIYREALANAIAAAKAEPRTTLRSVGSSFEIWANSSSQYAFVYENKAKIARADKAYRALVLLEVPLDPPIKTKANDWIIIGYGITHGDGRFRFSLTVILGTAAAIAAGLVAAWRVVRNRSGGASAALAFAGLTIANVTLVGNLLELGENNRFRFIVEPLTFVVVAALLAHAWRWFRDRRASRRDDPAPLVLNLS